MEPSQTLVQRPRSDGERVLVLGRYRLLERLGAGGFGVVWRALDEHLHREVALKRIELPSCEERERATREAHALARLSHPAIVSLYEACADEEAFFLISELVHGETLAELIHREELPDEQVAEIGLALTDALAHAHDRGVIHRDVKPQNVIVVSEPVERRGVAKLADFGGAQLVGEDALTRTGDVLGTLAYMAPEQSEGRDVGQASDVYSLALVLYEAFSGIQPVRGRTPAETARRIGQQIEPLERHRRDLDRALTATIDLALEPHPRDRATLGELRDALEAGLEGGLVHDRVTRRPLSKRRAVSSPSQASHEDDEDEAPSPSPSPSHAPTRRRASQRIPRGLWFGLVLALAVWQAAQGRTGVSLLALAAGTPLLSLPRRSGPGWLAAALAPALGLIGLAGAYPALAGQASHWRSRAFMAALGFWWLALAEPLLERRLWRGPASGTPPKAAWEGSLPHAASQVIASLADVQLLVGLVVWAAAAVVLPWIVRGYSAALDVAAAVTWAVLLVVALPLLDHGVLGVSAQPNPRGVVLGAVAGCALAVCARALRGPVGQGQRARATSLELRGGPDPRIVPVK